MKTTIRTITLFLAILLPLGASASRTVHVIESPNLHCNDTIVVYSPDTRTCCDKSASCCDARQDALPVLFLLHGYGATWRSWEEHTDLQALCDRFGFRIVCPDGFKDSWYINKTDETKMQWRDFFWNELWPLMDSEYGLDPHRTFIDGLSMGGHGAMNIFLDRPDLFAGAGSMSGVLDLKYSAGSKDLIPPMIGATHIEDPQCKAICAIHRLERINEVCGEDALSKMLVVSCGSSDTKFIPASEDFVRKCQEMGLRHIALFSPGKHRWEYWTWVLPFHLEWFSQAIN
ncbi:MAG: alpha/beta hydrolase [Candidatus Cryptobacteroides sp.]